MRANKHALAALNTRLGIPGRTFQRNTALFIHRRPRRKCAINGHFTDRQLVAAAGNDLGGDRLHEFGRHSGNRRLQFDLAGNSRRHLHFVQIGNGRVDRLEILGNNIRPLLAIRLFDRLLDLGNGLLFRQDAGDIKETGLHDRIDPAAHAGLISDRVSVNNKELELLFNNMLLGQTGQVIPNLVRGELAVKQKDRAFRRILKDIIPLQENELMATDKIRLTDQVRSVDRVWPEPQMRKGH